MGVPVVFRRKRKSAAKVAGQIQWFELEVCIQNEVDPESGMTLNLVHVDKLFDQWDRQVERSENPNPRSVLAEAGSFFLRELPPLGVQLASLELRALLGISSLLWTPGGLFCRVFRQVRVQAGDDAHVLAVDGVLPFVSEAEDLSSSSSFFEIRVESKGEILQRLADLFPMALQIQAQDLVSGQRWRREA